MLELRHVGKRYQEVVIDDVNITLPSCGFFLLKGPSGCGKSTLLHLLGGIDEEYTGDILWQGKNIREDKNFRKKARFIFQQFHLLEYLNGVQNSQLPKYFEETTTPKYSLSFHLKKKIHSFSGGQKQRIAIMRCLYSDVYILLCDEPTASLDTEASNEVMDVLKALSKECLVIVSSHQLQATFFDACLSMVDGKIASDKIPLTTKISTHKIESKSFPLLLFAFHQLLSKTKRNGKMLLGVTFALFSILFSFSLVEATNEQVKQQIYQSLPTTTITINPQENIFTYEDIYQGTKDYFTYIETTESMCIGISIEEEYDEKNILYIGDSTKDLKDSTYGTVPTNQNEVVLASSSAKKLFQGIDVELCIGETIYCWYMYEGNVLSTPLEVVGIQDENVLFDTMYLKEYSNIAHIEKLFGLSNPQIMVAMISVDYQEDVTQEEAILKRTFPNAKVEVSATSINEYMDDFFEQVEFVLFLFCFLAILSSCFLVGQVLFLSIVERKKEIGIIRCFGATKKQVFQLVLWEAIFIVSLAFILASLQYILVMTSINQWIESYLAIEFIGEFLTFDAMLFGIVYVLSLILSVISSSLPAYYGQSQDIVQSLRE